MAKISQTFGSSYFNADDFETKGTVLTIDRVAQAEVGKEERLVIHFTDHEKALPLNKTNALTLADKLGDDTDDWEGRQILVFRDTTVYKEKKTACIRVRLPKVTTASPGAVAGGGSGSGSPSASAKSA